VAGVAAVVESLILLPVAAAFSFSTILKRKTRPFIQAAFFIVIDTPSNRAARR